MKRRVLILRLDAIGDFIIFTACLRHFRAAYPNDELVLGINPVVSGIAQGCPSVDAVLEIDQKRYAADPEYAASISSQVRGRFDIAINSMYTRTWQSDHIIAKTHAPTKIGFRCLDRDGEEDRRRSQEVLYTALIDSKSEWLFELERLTGFIKALPGAAALPSLFPDLWLSDKEREQARTSLSKLGINPDRFAVLTPGAGDPIRYWSLDHFGAVARFLTDEENLDVVILGNKAESVLADGILAHHRNKIFNLCGATDLRRMLAIISEAKILVGTESAGFHMAWAANVPAVCIAGGGHFDRFLPRLPHVEIVNHPMDCYHCYWHCIYDEVKCITGITPEMVLAAVRKLLSSGAGKTSNRGQAN